MLLRLVWLTFVSTEMMETFAGTTGCEVGMITVKCVNMKRGCDYKETITLKRYVKYEKQKKNF